MPVPLPTEVLFEMTRVGDYMRVSAIDPNTGIEAVTFGPANASPHSLQQAGRRKLAYVLAQRERPGWPADTPVVQTDQAQPVPQATASQPTPVVAPLEVPGNRARGVLPDQPAFTPYGPRGRR